VPLTIDSKDSWVATVARSCQLVMDSFEYAGGVDGFVLRVGGDAPGFAREFHQ